MEKLTQEQIRTIKGSFPNISKEYLHCLSVEGWGEHESGYMFYSGPVLAKDLFGSEVPKKIQGFALIADDMSGYSIGFNLEGQLVGVDSSDWKVDLIKEGLNAYIQS